MSVILFLCSVFDDAADDRKSQVVEHSLRCFN